MASVAACGGSGRRKRWLAARPLRVAREVGVAQSAGAKRRRDATGYRHSLTAAMAEGGGEGGMPECTAPTLSSGRARGSPGVDARADRGRAVGWSALPTSRFFSKDPLAVVTLSHARTLMSIVGRHILWPRGALPASPPRRHSRNGKLRRADSEGARPSRSRSWATLPSLVCSLQMQLAAQAKRSPPAAFAPPPVCLHPPSRCSSPFVRCSHSPSTASSSSPPNHPSIWHCCSLQLVHRAASLLPPPAAIRCSLCSDHPSPRANHCDPTIRCAVTGTSRPQNLDGPSPSTLAAVACVPPTLN